jgi:hypothetical protein
MHLAILDGIFWIPGLLRCKQMSKDGRSVRGMQFRGRLYVSLVQRVKGLISSSRSSREVHSKAPDDWLLKDIRVQK